MMNIDEEARLKDAKTCTDCPEWLKYCKAECCKFVMIEMSPHELLKKGDDLDVKTLLTKDGIRYFKLRGVRYCHGIMKFPKQYCIASGPRILYIKRCELLSDDFLCKGHDDGRKPDFCKSLTMETRKNPKYHVTANCLFRYKEDEENEEKPDDEKRN